MAAAQDELKKEELTINEKLNEFIQKNRKILFLGLIAVIVVLIAFIAGFSINEKIRSNAFSKIDAFSRRYDALRYFVNSEESEAVSKQADINALLEEINAFAAKQSGFAAAQAYSISAGIYGDQKKWAEAENAWKLSARYGAKSYLGPVSAFNAAVAAEEQGNIEGALVQYANAIAGGNSFPAAARAQFSIGRLQESMNNRDAALDAYRTLVSRWPNDPVWSNLAQSRIMLLSD